MLAKNKLFTKTFRKRVLAFMLAAVLSVSCSSTPSIKAAALDTAEETADNAETGDAAETGDTAQETAAGQGTADAGEAVSSEGIKELSRAEALEKAIVSQPGNEIKGHKLIVEKGNYQMYLYEPALSIIIRDKTTGAIMESTVQESDGASNASWEGFMKSGIAIELQEDVNAQQPKLDLVNSGAQITSEITADGFTADIHYPTQQISLRFEVALNEDGSFTARVPEDSIQEESEKSKIGNIYVYPFLGYTHLGEREGYMLVPDGNGALINLDNKDGRFSNAYSQKVFGEDVGIDVSYVLSLFWDRYQTINDGENVMAPVYGMVHTDSKLGYLAIIESGMESATIDAYPNGAYTNYNWVTSKFMKHTVYTQPTSKSGGSVMQVTERTAYDIQMRYIFVNGEDADYAGLAKKYREYLLGNGELEQREDDFKIRLDFLGGERENWLFFKKKVTMTTTDDIRKIYEELEGEGVENILSLYKGWQKGGLYSLPVTKYKADSSIGGTRDLTKLIQESAEKGIDLYLYQDGLKANPSTGNTTFNVIKKIDKRLYEEDTYQDVYETMNYLTPSKSASGLKSLLKSYQKAGVNNMALGGISNTLFTYTYSGNTYTREDTRQVYEDTLKALDDTGASVVLDKPFAAYWQYTDAIIDMPVSDSDYIFTDQSIPFLSMVLKDIVPMYSDYTNFEANKKEFFLKLVETGIYPSFYLTMEDSSSLLYTNSSDIFSSKYSVYKEEVMEYYAELKKVNEQIKGSAVTDHEMLENGLTVVTYENGIKVYINYSDKDVAQDGVTVKAMSYEIR